MPNVRYAAALIAISLSGSALAADLPSRRAPPVYIPPPVPVFSWTGFYAGGQVGYEFGRDNVATNFGPIGNYQMRPQGVIGGAHIGYNFSTQSLAALPLFGGFSNLFGGGLVLGIEGDVNGIDDRATAVRGPGTYAQNHRKDIEGSVRGRLGVAVDRALFYATGGAAFAQFHDSYGLAPGVDALFPAGVISNQSSTRVGWTVGGGVEYAVTPNWTLRAEYRYTDFGRYLNVGTPDPRLVASNRITDNRVQLGFSYLFSTPVAAPVVARY